MSINFNRIRPIELKAMRMSRGLNTTKFCKLSLLAPSKVKVFENRQHGYVPRDIALKYVNTLEIKENEYNRLLLLLDGKTNGYEQERSIPSYVKKQVKFRDNNQCVNCGAKNKLHFHHKQKFSDGGLHVLSNIVLLCVKCHAKEHKGEKAFHLLKVASKE